MYFLVPIHSNPDVDLESQATSFDHYIPPCRLVDSGNGFMLISDENEIDSLSHAYRVLLLNFSLKNVNIFDYRKEQLYSIPSQATQILIILCVTNVQII